MKQKGCGPYNLGSPLKQVKQTKKQRREYDNLTRAFDGFNQATDTIITGRSNIPSFASHQAQLNAFSGRDLVDQRVEDQKRFQDSKGNVVVANKHKKKKKILEKNKKN